MDHSNPLKKLAKLGLNQVQRIQVAVARMFDQGKEELLREFHQKGYLYKEYDYLKKSVAKQDTLKITSLVVGIEGSYGNTALSKEFIKTHWNNGQFEVINVLEGIIDFRQDLVILKRKSDN